MFGIRTTFVFAVVPLLALAQQEGTGKGQEAPAQLEIRKAPPLIGSQQLIGIPIQDKGQKTCGRVEDLVLHPKGDIAFVIASYAGWMDMKEVAFVVPWAVTSFDFEKQIMHVDLDEKGFRDARRYEAGKMPKLDDMDWWNDTDEHYAKLKESKGNPIEANVSLAPTKRLYLLSEKKGEQVYDETGQKIGEIRELALDPRAARASFVVVSVGGYLGSGDKLVAVPWEALSTIPDADNPKLLRTVLATTRERLKDAPEFRADSEAKQMEDPEWILAVYQFYSVPPYWSVRAKPPSEGGK